jgi:hypothetical protein
MVGFGAVFGDDKGHLLACAIKRVRGSWPPEVAEAHSLAHGVESAFQLGFKFLVAETDSKTVIDRLWAGDHSSTSLGIALEDYHICGSKLDCMVSCTQTGNMHAHIFSK